MIRGIGLVIIALQEVHHWNDEGVLRRIWTPGELEYCTSHRSPERHLAARYAAKLAVLNVLGIQQAREQEEIPFTAIEIRRAPSGLPYPVLHEGAASRALHMQITRWHLSLTHEGSHAAAFALAEGRELWPPCPIIVGASPVRHQR